MCAVCLSGLYLLLRVQWYRLLQQGKIDSKLAEKMQSLWQDLAHARRQLQPLLRRHRQSMGGDFCRHHRNLPLQWQATFSSASWEVLPKVNLSRLQQVHGAADWQNPSEVLTVLFNSRGNAVRLQQCEDLDALAACACGRDTCLAWRRQLLQQYGVAVDVCVGKNEFASRC